MASPFANWLPTRPTDTEAVSIYPAFARNTWAVLGTIGSGGGVLGTLGALAGTSGSVTTGWRQNQGNNDDTWLMQNGYMSNASGAAVTFARDDTGKASLAFTKEISGPYFRWLYTAAAANPITWTELMRLTSAGVLQGLTALSLGTTPAATSVIRIPNSQGLYGRNVANNADIALVYLDNSNNVEIGSHTMPTNTGVFDLGTTASVWRNVYVSGDVLNTSGVAKYVPTMVLKKGTTTNYTTTSATYVDVDATNLAYTVTVPTGSKVLIVVGGVTVQVNSAGALAQVALTDSTTVLAEMQQNNNGLTSADGEFPLTYVFTGDGASHTFKLRWQTSAGTATMLSSSATLTPMMTFWMGVSN